MWMFTWKVSLSTAKPTQQLEQYPLVQNVLHDAVFISALLVLTSCHQVSQQQPVQQQQEYGSTQVMMAYA